jgi:hypothetical protein
VQPYCVQGSELVVFQYYIVSVIAFHEKGVKCFGPPRAVELMMMMMMMMMTMVSMYNYNSVLYKFAGSTFQKILKL